MLSFMFKASAVIELRFICNGDYWSVIISFFLAVLYFVRQKFSGISSIYRKHPFIMELILMINILIKHLRKPKMSMMMEISETMKNSFSKKWFSIRQIYVSVKIR